MLLSLSKKPNVPVRCTFLTSNLSAFKIGLPGRGAAARTHGAGGPACPQLPRRPPVFAQVSVGNEVGLRKRSEEGSRKMELQLQLIILQLCFTQVLISPFGLPRYIRC